MLHGGLGDDLLYGNSGADVFVVELLGNDVIADFKLGQDRLSFDNSTIADFTPEDFASLASTNDDGHLQFTMNDQNSLEMSGLTLERLQEEAEEQDIENWEELLFG